MNIFWDFLKFDEEFCQYHFFISTFLMLGFNSTDNFLILAFCVEVALKRVDFPTLEVLDFYI